MRDQGFSLIELLITLVIAGILLAMGIPPLLTVIASTQSRTVAEAIQSGLKLARAEAIGRNAPMRFQLVTDLTSACAYSTSSMLWVVTQTNQVPLVPPPTPPVVTTGLVAGFCNATPFVPPDQLYPCSPEPAVCACNPDTTPSCNRATLAANCRPLGNPATCANEPYIVVKSMDKTYPSVKVEADAAIVTFGPLGQVLTNLEGAGTQPSLSQIRIKPDDPDAKIWRVRINRTSGAIKLCDPSLDAALVPPPPLACT